MPIANAQISIGEKASQKSVEVMIDEDGKVHVKHVIHSSSLPKNLDLIYGTVSNISVMNEQGNELQFGTVSGTNSILLNPSNEKLIVEYDLEHVLTKVNNVWTWSFQYLETTSFIFSEEVDLIFVNENPIKLDEKKGIACHGCQMILEYSIEQPTILKNVNWENNEFLVEIQSHNDVNEFNFDQPTKSITFDVVEKNQFITIIIPLELLWEPYSVFLDNEKIPYHTYFNNGTHVWLNMKPESAGQIMVIGTTVIPEFPIVAPLAIGFLIIIAIPFMKKINLH
ncbi:MAG: hypothetical protein MAG458_00616 [Nitrosopumilus sp.]|nr:hypothetical protein [Nitrosopumilus sp.]